MRAGRIVGAVNLFRQRTVKNVVDQRRFAAARDAGDDDKAAERKRHINALQIMLRGAPDMNRFARALPPLRGNRNLHRASEILPGKRMRIGANFRGSSLPHQFSAEPSGARTQIDHVIGALDGFGIVFHHQHRVSHVAKGRQRIQQAVVIPRMQPDGRLVQNVQHAAELRANLRGQPDPLRFATRQRGRRTVQTQVVQADRLEELQPAPNLIHHSLGNRQIARRKLPGPRRQQGPRNRHSREIRDGQAFHAHRETGLP